MLEMILQKPVAKLEDKMDVLFSTPHCLPVGGFLGKVCPKNSKFNFTQL